MPEGARGTFVCPGCGHVVEADENFVEAYEREPDFRLHSNGADSTVIRRFHVEHFRGRTSGHFYELVSHEHPVA